MTVHATTLPLNIRSAPRYYFHDENYPLFQLSDESGFHTAEASLKDISTTGVCFFIPKENLTPNSSWQEGDKIHIHLNAFSITPMTCLATITRQWSDDLSIYFAAEFQNFPMLYKERLSQKIIQALIEEKLPPPNPIYLQKVENKKRFQNFLGMALFNILLGLFAYTMYQLIR